MESAIAHPGGSLNCSRPRAAQGFVRRKRAVEVVRIGSDELSEGDGVLDRGVRALAVVRQHRVGCVADQHDATAPPATQSPRKKKTPAQLVARRRCSAA